MFVVCLLVLFVVVFCWLDYIMHMGRIYLYIHSFWPYYIYNSSMLAHQMPPRRDTRRNAAGGDNNGNGRGNGNGNGGNNNQNHGLHVR